MTQGFTSWVSQSGLWDFKSDVVTYMGPQPGISRPFGICASNNRSTEGIVHLTVTIPHSNKLSSEGQSAGALIGYSRRAPSYAIGIGGHSRKYTIVLHDPEARTWTFLDGAGAASDLEIAHEYRLGVHIEGAKVSLYDAGTLICDHLLKTPISQDGKFGLFAWGDTRVEFTDLSFENAVPADAAISIALASFDRNGVLNVWHKALERRSSDPEGAITTARTLLETTCKRILDENKKTYAPAADLPILYRAVAELLDLAPNQQTEETFKIIFGNCSQIVTRLGELRNQVGDAHGAGAQAPKVAPRHASLAVNLAGAMALFLVETANRP